MTNKKKKKQKKSGGMMRIGLLYLACLILAVVFKGSFIFFLVGMLPSIVAYIADTTKQKEIYRCVLACNIAGMLPYAKKVFSVSLDESLRIIIDPSMWFVIYTFAGGGWLLIWLMPYMAELVTEFGQNARIAKLEAIQKQLVNEWGAEIQRKVELLP
jgi:uncharacterized membrane protein